MTAALDPLSLTRELIRFETINPPGRELDCLEHLAAILRAAGLTASLHPFGERRANLVAALGTDPSRSPLCFTGHVDTVPLGSAPWSRDPFAGEVADGRLFGRGASDMKSGVAAFVATACVLAPRLNGAGRIVLVITGGEETGCEGAAALAQAGLLERAGALVVAEPTANAPVIGHKGALWLRAVATGVTAHGSMPHLGVNAAYKAGRALMKLDGFEFNAEPHPALGKPTLNVGAVRAGLNVNSVPDRAEIDIDIRTVPSLPHARAREHIAAELGPDIAVETLVDVGPVWTEPSDAWVQDVVSVAAEVTGAAGVAPATAPYFTDASVLKPALGDPPTVILGPGEPAMSHQTDEYCTVARIHEAADIYAGLIRRWYRL